MFFFVFDNVWNLDNVIIKCNSYLIIFLFVLELFYKEDIVLISILFILGKKLVYDLKNLFEI